MHAHILACMYYVRLSVCRHVLYAFTMHASTYVSILQAIPSHHAIIIAQYLPTLDFCCTTTFSTADQVHENSTMHLHEQSGDVLSIMAGTSRWKADRLELTVPVRAVRAAARLGECIGHDQSSGRIAHVAVRLASFGIW